MKKFNFINQKSNILRSTFCLLLVLSACTPDPTGSVILPVAPAPPVYDNIDDLVGKFQADHLVRIVATVPSFPLPIALPSTTQIDGARFDFSKTDENSGILSFSIDSITLTLPGVDAPVGPFRVEYDLPLNEIQATDGVLTLSPDQENTNVRLISTDVPFPFPLPKPQKITITRSRNRDIFFSEMITDFSFSTTSLDETVTEGLSVLLTTLGLTIPAENLRGDAKLQIIVNLSNIVPTEETEE